MSISSCLIIVGKLLGFYLGYQYRSMQLNNPQLAIDQQNQTQMENNVIERIESFYGENPNL
jgi:hypothetical protein